MAKQAMSIRLDEVSISLMDAMVEKLRADGVSTNRTDVIQKALYVFARETVLGAGEVSSIIDDHYNKALHERARLAR